MDSSSALDYGQEVCSIFLINEFLQILLSPSLSLSSYLIHKPRVFSFLQLSILLSSHILMAIELSMVV